MFFIKLKTGLFLSIGGSLVALAHISNRLRILQGSYIFFSVSRLYCEIFPQRGFATISTATVNKIIYISSTTSPHLLLLFI